MHHPSMTNSAPETIPLANGSVISFAAFDPATHTAANMAASTSATAKEIARLQEIAAKHLGRFPVAAPALIAWVNAHAALQVSVAKGASVGLAEMRTNLDTFLVASDAIPAAVAGNWG